MISFNNLGHMGRLGNQMFQYASLRGIAAKHGYQYSVPSNVSLFECFNLPVTESNNNQRSINVEKYEFDENVFENCPDNVDLVGYFQTEKYFQNIEDQIRDLYRFKEKVSSICRHYIQQIYSNEVIALHIRRTDYLTDTSFHVLDLDHYHNALELFDKDLPVLVISDDPEWCKEHFKEKRFRISLTKNPQMDLCLMTMCSHHIIANSSFGWWGSWLAKSKQTVASKKWFAGNLSHWNTKDLYLPEWITI